MPYKEKEPEKIYHTIGEVAAMFGIATSNIRFWEKEFDILKPKKNKKGDRLFTRQDVENIKLIYHLVKEQGFTLQGAKDRIKHLKQTDPGKQELIDSLKRVRDFLLEIKGNL